MTYNENGIEYSILKHIGTIRTYPTGWSKEINIVCWNKGIPKFDIRDWSPEHNRMTRGITLMTDEAKELAAVLGEYLNGEKEKFAV